MTVIADSIEAAVELLNLGDDEWQDFQIDEDCIIEYNKNPADTIYWSYEEITMDITGKTAFRFYC